MRKFATKRKSISPTAATINSLEIVVDKMHMAGHVDKWCKDNCDARTFPELDNVSDLTLSITAFM